MWLRKKKKKEVIFISFYRKANIPYDLTDAIFSVSNSAPPCDRSWPPGGAEPAVSNHGLNADGSGNHVASWNRKFKKSGGSKHFWLSKNTLFHLRCHGDIWRNKNTPVFNICLAQTSAMTLHFYPTGKSFLDFLSQIKRDCNFPPTRL